MGSTSFAFGEQKATFVKQPPLTSSLLALARRLDTDVENGFSAFNRSVLLIVLVIATVLSCHEFIFDQTSPDGSESRAAAVWVYASLALLTALSLTVHKRLPAFRSCAFAVPTAALGASFIILDSRTQLGWVLVLGTIAAATPLVVLEVLKAWHRQVHQAPTVEADSTEIN